MEDSYDTRWYWFWLNQLEGIGNAKIRKLLELFQSPKEIYFGKETQFLTLPQLSAKDIGTLLSDQNKIRIRKEYEDFLKKQIRFLVPEDPAYPKRLLQLYDRPFILYYKGTVPSEKRKAAAIVGARKCSAYGRAAAGELGRLLAKHGVDVISGLAAGIDYEAHYACLHGGGTTYAVLAGSVETCYPAQNFNLYMDILESGGGILSEYPPGVAPRPGMFPARNRIISGLADAVVVVEAGEKSGALITAAQALEQNRSVFAVPGRIGDPCSIGCNELIREGAGVVASWDRFLEEIGCAPPVKKTKNENLALAPPEKMLYSLLLDFTPRSLETLLAESGLPVAKITKALVSLELQSLIKEISKNFYVRIM